jgi:ubiquinone/menaquinone biosynthesis C-methylase UbiE
MDFLKDTVKKTENDLVLSFLNESDSSRFYNELFSTSFAKKQKPALFDSVKETQREKGEAYRTMEAIVSFLEKELKKDAVIIELGGGVHQKRSADAYRRFNHYFPLDISYSNIKSYTQTFGKEGFVADATQLPFKDNSIDCIFTHTFLEHPIEPEKVVSEIVRVLKPGGIIIHNDAWFCRWWHRFGIVGLEKFDQLNFTEKCIYLAAKITEFPLFRIPPIILRRFLTQVFNPKAKNIALRYKKLKPNYNLHLGCDEDAASRLDPIDVIRFYESRQFALLKPLSFKERLFHPNKYIALRKAVI